MPLWKFSADPVWLTSLIVSLVLLGLISTVKTNAQYIALLLVIVASVLMFAFLTRLPAGTLTRRVLDEARNLIGASLLIFLSAAWLSVVSPATFTIAPGALQVFALMAIGSHLLVRGFARPVAVWEKMRRRHLVWEITHAQLRLVLLVIIIAFLFIVHRIIVGDDYNTQSAPDFIVNAVTLLISMAGFFGILTGILLFIVVIPAGVISYVTAQRLTRRLQTLIAVTHTVRDARDPVRVTVEGEDEIALLQTDFNSMMDRLEAARRDLEHERDTVRQLLKVRQRLFADVSHELRTPITTILSYLGSIKSAESSEDIAVIEREARRLQHLVDDVFTVARADLDQLHYDIKPLEISAVLERTAQTMRHQAWQARKVEVVLDYQPQIPLVLVDEERLEQALYNLLYNAVRHTPPGGLIRIAAAVQPETVTIEVQDTGEGIAPEDLPHIWERFYRSNEARASDSSGAGLGLALVKEMIETMGGQVAVSSQVGRGSHFSLILRRVR